MQYNRLLRISTAGSRKATCWSVSEILWSDLAERLRVPVRSTESMEEYLALPKAKQDDLKDVGGYVGGTLAGNRRKADCVQGRDVVTLDLDAIPAGQTDDILRRVDGLGCAALVYSTRKHTGYHPRLRVLIPLDQTATADQYEPVARKVASLIGIEFCDPTTFEASRMMYWASCCQDSEYAYQVYDKPFASLPGILALYEDWQDITKWPQVPGIEALEKRRLSRQEDPTQKQGIVGAFCRTYTITEAMDQFLAGVYEPTDLPGRYTYTGGSTTGGAIVYDGDRFLYSHHATDPCSGQLVNAFDLVRLHYYGELDKDAKEGTPGHKLPSFQAMAKAAQADPQVAQRVAQERFQSAQEAFGGEENAPATEDASAIYGKLEMGADGKCKNTLNNAILVLEQDPRLKGKIVTDEFASCGMVLGSVPWDSREDARRWTEVDDAGFYRYVEVFYGLTGRERLDMALTYVSAQNKINAVSRYLKGLSWDGVARLDTLLSVYLGAEDTPYTRAVMRKSLCAAVARAIDGGVKYDTMPIFTGPQGIGKSTFLNILGKEWFSDSLTSFEGKEAAELIQGTWINEVGELTAMGRQETNAVKQFLSKTHDIYRAAYGRRTERYPRRCVFFGTSNASEFLKDSTGNRRFWPVDVGEHPAQKSVWKDLPGEVDQIWAEAYAYWAKGEPLFLPPELERVAKEQQEKHRETTGKEGLIQEFLEKPVPKNWEQMSIQNRRMYLAGGLQSNEELCKREKICLAEIWVECLGGDMKYMKRSDSTELAGIMQTMPGWIRSKNPRHQGPYGKQKGYERV